MGLWNRKRHYPGLGNTEIPDVREAADDYSGLSAMDLMDILDHSKISAPINTSVLVGVPQKPAEPTFYKRTKGLPTRGDLSLLRRVLKLRNKLRKEAEIGK